MDNPGYVHLRVHSAYSLLEGALPISKILELTAGDDMPAVGIGDTGNLFGALEFSDKAASKGVQPIVGCQLLIDFGDVASDPRRSNSLQDQGSIGSIFLIAKTKEGFTHLSKVVSHSFLETEGASKPHITAEMLAQHSAGLICLSGGDEGAINQKLLQGFEADARKRLLRLHQIFGNDLYVELQRHGSAGENQTEKFLVEFAYEMDVGLVATNGVFFPSRDDYQAHDALMAIAEGRMIAEDDRRKLTPEQFFKSRSEMVELFADLPEAVENTVQIAMSCIYRPQKHAPILPRFGSDVAKDSENRGSEPATRDEASELRRQAQEGLKLRLREQGAAPGLGIDAYEARLEYELGVIERMEYPGYFLIVADFIKWAKANDVPVGPGRGSGAGSLVAWSLTITDIDPLQFSLLFERFLNPERVSMPDFDIDFCQDKRDLVIRYVQEKYGTSQVAQIITFGTLQARAVLRDVGRVLQMPYGQVDRLCKMVPSNPANPVTLKEAIAGEPTLQEAAEKEEVVAQLFSIATRLEGLYRHASTHAAGIVIGDRPLEELVPLYRDPRSDMPVTQYNMKWVEQAGLVKFDFLGLKTLTILERASALIARRGVTIDFSNLPLDDKATYEMLSRGETAGVFQLESQGMRRALAGMKPDRFEDIIALVALYRPGPMDNIPTYNRRKHGLEEPDYLHPKLEGILKETYGVIIYQEQVMQIAQELSGYSLGEADLLRRAMGKKIKAEMDVQRQRFVDGAIERGTPAADANTIFDLVARFADYGFNKSHAAAYALVAYQTAFLKANHPVEFLAASMTLDLGNTDKLSDFRQEADRMGIEITTPCILRSSYEFEVNDGKIVYALGALKGVGHNVIDAIMQARGERSFDGLSDFAERVDAKVMNKRALEALVAAGAFDCMVKNRAQVMAGLDRIIAHAQRVSENSRIGQDELFGGNGQSGEIIELPSTVAWKSSEQLSMEHKAIGLYLSGHPLDEYDEILKKMKIPTWSDFQDEVRKGTAAGRLAATVISKQERKTRSGSKMGILNLSDTSGQFEGTLYAEKLLEYRDVLTPGRAFLFTVGADLDDETDEVRVRIQSLVPLDKATQNGFSKLQIFAEDESPFSSIAKQIASVARNDETVIRNGSRTNGASNHTPRQSNLEAGTVELVLLLDNGNLDAVLELPGAYDLSPEIAGAIKAIQGVVDVKLR